VGPRVVHEDTAHHAGSDAEEVAAILPLDASLVDETQIRLVHQRRRLQRVIGPLAAKMGAGQPAQLVIDEREKLFLDGRVAAAPLGEQRGYVWRRLLCHVRTSDGS